MCQIVWLHGRNDLVDRSWYQFVRYRPLAEGYKPGVPDLFVCEARGCFAGLFIETKRRDGSKVTADQLEWHRRLRDRGYLVVVAAGATAAINAIKAYLKQEP